MLRWAVGYDADQIVASLAAEAQWCLMTQTPLWSCCLVHITWIHIRTHPHFENLRTDASASHHTANKFKKEGFVGCIHRWKYLGLLIQKCISFSIHPAVNIY